MDEVEDAGTDAGTDRAELAGCVIAGKYFLEHYIGSGSTGAVYRARHSVLEKPVALKILDPDLARSPEMVELFKREAKAASRLDHPNSVRVIDFGTEGSDLLYIVMEFVEGPDLLQVVDEQFPLAEERVVDIMCQILGALAQAHGFGVIHRDLKPENVLLLSATSDEGNATDVVKVCDFGVAQLSPLAVPAQPLPRVGPEHPTVIDVGTLVGTPEYMSPEQARGEPLDPRSDVYAAGVVMFQLLTRRLPFTGGSAADVAMLQCYAPLPRPSAFAPISVPLEAICMKALNKDPLQRYQSAREMRVALRQAASLDRAPTLRLSAMSNAPPAAGAAAIASVAKLAPEVPAEARATQPFPAEPDTMSPPVAMAVRRRAGSRLRRPTVALAAIAVLPALAAAAYLWPRGSVDDAMQSLKRRGGATSALSATAASQATTAVSGIAPALRGGTMSTAHAQPDARPGFDALAVSVVEGATEPAQVQVAPAPVVAPSEPEERSEARERRSARRAPKPAREAPEPAGTSSTTDAALTEAAESIASPGLELASAGAQSPATGGAAGVSEDISLDFLTEDASAPAPSADPEPTADSQPLPTPKQSVVARATSEPLTARARIHDVTVQGSLPTSVVERAIRRVRPQLSACYARTAVSAGRNAYGQVKIDVEFDERGRVRRASANGGELPGLDDCVGEVAGKLVTRQAPDTGTVKASWRVAFER